MIKQSNDDAIRSKLALIKLVDELNSVSKACEIMGYSRDSYYRFKKLYDTGGSLALKNIERSKPIVKNRVSKEIEKQVVEFALDYPNYGQEKVSRLLKARGVSISASGVRSVWKRYDLESKTKRLKALHAKLEQQKTELTEEQRVHIEHLHALKQEQTELDTDYPGNICVQDSYFVGNIPNLGEVYQQTFIDAYSKMAFAKLYTRKHGECSIEMLKNTVLPWFTDKGISIEQVLTDKGAEFYGSSNGGDQYQTLLKSMNVEHIKMRAYNSPEVNGICARFHSVQKSHLYDLLLRSKSFTQLVELEQELANWLTIYNTETPHQERYCYGKTPAETFQQSVHLSKSC